MWGGHLDSRPVALLGSCDEISHRRLFPRSRQCNSPSLSSPSPLTKECSPATCPGPFDNPERTAQPRLLARTGAAHAGRDPSGRQSSARSPAISRNAPRAPGPANAAALPWREAMARFERHGSELAARPDVALGATADPQGSCGTRPRGDRSWRCSTAQPASELRPGGSGCATQGEPRGPSSTLRTVLRRPTLGTNQTQSPHLHRVRSECLALRMRRLDVPY